MPYISSTERIAREEGLLQGIRQGISEGIERGRRKGRIKGQLEQAPKAVLEVLEVRFPFAVKEEIICCNDLGRLTKAHRQALLIASVDAFEL